jgi:hypothetical protein
MAISDQLQNFLDNHAPSGLQREYHGNGPNAWYGPDTYEHTDNNGNVVKIVETSRRYSYRWHKKVFSYYINDCRYYHRSSFKAALRRL